jgi:hypothetical protein
MKLTSIPSDHLPMIGTCVVKTTRRVQRLLESIDFPVREVMIINNNGKGELDSELDRLASVKYPNVGKVRIFHMPMNLGVAASWNLMIKSYMMDPCWIIVNDDVAFGPGFLQEMHSIIHGDPSIHVIHGHHGDFNVGSFDLFLIRDHTIQEFGLFDENLYPAYNEDTDYIMRCLIGKARRVCGMQSNYMHGDGDKTQYAIHGSHTKRSDAELAQKLDTVNGMNIEYLNGKWGTGWRMCDPTAAPFLSSGTTLPLSYTKFDLTFVRSKYLGF